MIDGLVGGRLYGEAQIRTGQNGKRYVTCKVRATTGDGDTLFVNVIAFDDEVQTGLLALSDADNVALSGALISLSPFWPVVPPSSQRSRSPSWRSWPPACWAAASAWRRPNSFGYRRTR